MSPVDYEQNEEKMAAMGLDTEGLLAQTGDLVNQMGIGEYTVQGGEYMANSKVGEKGKMEYDHPLLLPSYTLTLLHPP